MISNTEVSGEFRNTIAKAGWDWLPKHEVELEVIDGE
jgi:hypothetical protein